MVEDEARGRSLFEGSALEEGAQSGELGLERF